MARNDKALSAAVKTAGLAKVNALDLEREVKSARLTKSKLPVVPVGARGRLGVRRRCHAVLVWLAETANVPP